MRRPLACGGLLALACLGAAGAGAAAPPLAPAACRAEACRAWHPLAGHLEVLRDPSGALRAEEVARAAPGSFQDAGPGPLSLGVVEDTVWLRFRLALPAEPAAGAADPWVLALGRPWGGWVELHLPVREPDGGVRWRRQPGGLPGASGEASAWRRSAAFTLPAGLPADQPVLLRVRTSSSIFLPLELGRASALRRWEQLERLGLGLYDGVALALVVLNLLLFLGVRDPSQLLYALHLLCLTGFFAMKNGLGWELFPGMGEGTYHAVTHALLGAALVLAGLFARAFLGTRARSRPLDVFLCAYVGLAGVALLSAPLLGPAWANRVFPALGVASPLWALVAGAVVWWRGLAPAGIFLLAFGLTSLGGLANGLVLGGALPYSPLAYHAFQACSAAGGLLLTLALGQRLRAERRARLELERARGTAEAATQAKRRFVALVSHELRTPLNGILGMGDLLLEGPLHPTQRAQASALRASAQALLRLIEDLLESARRDSGELPGPPRPAASAPPRGLRVLVVEDQPLNRQVARSLLEHLGCQVELAEDGEQALRALAGGAFDLVLMDLELPGQDGLAVTRRLRAAAPAAGPPPVLALTAHDDPVLRARCQEAGMAGYLTKPLELTTLARALARHAPPG